MVRLGAGVFVAMLIAQGVTAQEPPQSDGWVVLPIEEYRTLRARAFPAPPDPAPPPVDAALTRVDYELRTAGDSVSGQARLTIDVLKQGWAAVQVPAGMLVRDARIDGRPTALTVTEPGAPPRVLLSRPGRSTLVLDVVVPLASTAGAESITLPGSASALSAVTLTVPRAGVALTVGGGFIAETSEAAAESRWVVYGQPGRTLTFTWKRKAEDRRAALPARSRARITELVALGEDSTQVTASVQIDVTQGLVRSAIVALPAGLIVNEVAGATVADWDVNRNELTVTFLEPVAASTSVVVTGEVRTPREGAVTIPIVRVPSAERETGGIAVDITGPGEIARGEPRGLEAADAGDLGDIVAGRESPSMVAYRFTPMAGAAARSLSVNVTRYTPKAVLVANIEEARYDVLAGEDGKVLVRARYAIRNNQRSFLAVSLPPRAALWSASLAGRPLRPGVASGGGLLLPLQKGRPNETATTFVVELMYLQRTESWTDRGEGRIELPAVDLPVGRTGLMLRRSTRYEITAKPGSFRVTDDPGPFSAALRERDGVAAAAAPRNSPPPPPPQAAAGREAKDLQALVDRLQKEASRSRQGIVPIAIAFPSIGMGLFLAAELTPEAQAPVIEFQYRRVIHRANDTGGL